MPCLAGGKSKDRRRIKGKDKGDKEQSVLMPVKEKDKAHLCWKIVLCGINMKPLWQPLDTRVGCSSKNSTNECFQKSEK
jgi:hypothetical protein